MLAALTGELQRLGESDLRRFERRVYAELKSLDTLELRDVAGQLWVVSGDNWTHFRAWCVCQGQEFITRLRAHPGAVLRDISSKRSGPFDVPNGELFLYCAEYARVARSKAVA